MGAFELFQAIRFKRSFLCVGLDPDYAKIPEFLKTGPDALFEFNKMIIDATAPYAVAFKPNLAFYEVHGVTGWVNFKKTVEYIKEKYPSILLIADAKRGDIGNTAAKYAATFFKQMPCDAVTLAPYMGEDSVQPFLKYPGKWAIILALTSNPSSMNFQFMEDKYSGLRMFERILDYSKNWGTEDNTMYVVGATKPEMFEAVRSIVPNHFLLVPGVGAQGGSLREVARMGMNQQCGLLVNSSRAIIHADSTENFAEIAKQKAEEMQQEMDKLLQQRYLV